MFGADKVINALSDNTAARIHIIVKETTASTNLDIKELAANGAAEGTVVIAGKQTAGRGRLGRSFYSPENSGLYMSILLRPELSASDALHITACCAPAAAEAIESVCSCKAGIKWVNDIYVENRKVCGILVESSVDMKGRFDFAVLGIGVNVSREEFPEELRDKAGTLGIDEKFRPALAAAILEHFFRYYDALPERTYLPEYRRRSILTGKTVEYTLKGAVHNAVVSGIDDNAALIVIDESGREVHLNSGEVSVKMQNNHT